MCELNMIPNLTITNKRKLRYEYKPTVTTPHREADSSVRRKRGEPTPGYSGWAHRMDGFEGLQVDEDTEEDTRRKKKRRLSDFQHILEVPVHVDGADGSNKLDNDGGVDIDSDSGSDIPIEEVCSGDQHPSSQTQLSRLSTLPKPKFYKKTKPRKAYVPPNQLDIQAPDSPSACDIIESECEPSDIFEQEISAKSPTKNTKPRLSDWTKSFQLVTPVKDQADSCLSAEDSAKKKKSKFSSGGLAERLSKLISRQRSEYSFWTHKMKVQESGLESRRSITVRMDTCVRGPSLVIAECLVLALSAEKCDLSVGDDVQVLVSVRGKSAVSDGAVLQIFAPWQSLKIKRKSIVLCTDYHVICTSGNGNLRDMFEVGDTYIKFRKEISVYAEMRCPCSNTDVSPDQCNAHLLSTKPLQLRETRPGEPSETPSPAAHLTSVSTRSDSQSSSDSSILDSIAHKGGCTASRVSFTAHVQRVYTREQRPPAARWCSKLVVQDTHGFICAIMLPELNPNCGLTELLSSEGKVYSFSGLQVQHRVTRERLPSFFSIISSIWRKESVQPSRTSQDGSQESDTALPDQPYGFSYMLQASPGQTACMAVSPSSSIYVARETQAVSDVIALTGTAASQRENIDSSSDKFRTVHITDSGGSYLSVKLLSCFSQKLKFCKELCYSVICQDVLATAGCLIADEYTGIQMKSRASRVRREVGLPSPSDDTKPGDLVTVQGTVVDVDYENSYSFVICSMCNKESLSGGTAAHPFVFCNECKRSCDEPLTKLKMTVFMSCENAAELNLVKSVRVQLSEATIHALLPSDCEEEAHDVTAVLGQCVGPIACVVTSLAHEGKHSKNLAMEQITVY